VADVEYAARMVTGAWTWRVGIVQIKIANPSKHGACLAIFNWTRQVAGVLSG
jgi:hypothetical protein